MKRRAQNDVCETCASAGGYLWLKIDSSRSLSLNEAKGSERRLWLNYYCRKKAQKEKDIFSVLLCAFSWLNKICVISEIRG